MRQQINSEQICLEGKDCHRTHLAYAGAHINHRCINRVLLCRSLGTESNQPPEMLVSKECGARKQFGKLPVVSGSSSPSDVWSLGCLLFELFTGNLLYPDSEDFSKFFSMLTGMSDEVSTAYTALIN